MTIDEFGRLADEVADDIPPEFFGQLNGGIILNAEAKQHEDSRPGSPLYVMGEYTHSRMMGRHIVIYYGSFMRAYSGCGTEQLKEHLRKTILHEFRHHLESLSGTRELEDIDASRLAAYLSGFDSDK